MPYRLCRHIHTTGLQCQSPALLRQSFCYFHANLRRRTRAVPPPDPGEVIAPTYDSKGRFTGMETVRPADVPHTFGTSQTPHALDLGLLEDSNAVQVAISTVVHAIASNTLDMRRATALLYGLQLASINCRNLPEPPHVPADLLRLTVPDSDGNPIAQDGLFHGDEWSYPEDDQSPENPAGEAKTPPTPME